VSIRLRLIIWYSVVFTIGLTAFALVVWFGTHATLQDHIDTGLILQAGGLDEFLRRETHGPGEAAAIEEIREFSTGLPEGNGVQLFTHDGRLLFSQPPTTLATMPAQPATLIYQGNPIRALGQPVTIFGHEYRFTLWRSLKDSEAALDDLRLVLMTLVPAFILLSFGGGWFLGNRALRPVDEITKIARKISLQNLSGSLPVPRHRDELQRLCMAWNEMLHRLNTSAQQLQQFTADASHELRTPVALIRATAELALRQDRPPDHYRNALREIQRESEELTCSIESLLELARADSGQFGFSFATLTVQDLVMGIRTQVENLAMQTNIEFVVHLPSEELSVLGDRGALRRLLLALLENAIKFTRSPGRVELTAARVEQQVLLEIRDTGIGISAHDLPRIFNRFFQADGSRSGSGVGLGLSIAQWIVKAHNGQIEVESQSGQGSIFRVLIPLAPEM
jgi:signal transduction histidine kinase